MAKILAFSPYNEFTVPQLKNLTLNSFWFYKLAGGLPWTIIKTTSRSEYLKVLDSAHLGGTIFPFARFIAAQMKN